MSNVGFITWLSVCGTVNNGPRCYVDFLEWETQTDIYGSNWLARKRILMLARDSITCIDKHTQTHRMCITWLVQKWRNSIGYKVELRRFKLTHGCSPVTVCKIAMGQQNRCKAYQWMPQIKINWNPKIERNIQCNLVTTEMAGEYWQFNEGPSKSSKEIEWHWSRQ